MAKCINVKVLIISLTLNFMENSVHDYDSRDSNTCIPRTVVLLICKWTDLEKSSMESQVGENRY